MSFKTKEEMFGDNAGFGAAVPYNTSNPPGTGAGNRGVGYGEQLTASIANRPHYALCLNDEDLNERLVPFEGSGLDAVYRLGTAAVAGGGRNVVVDGGAIETTYTLASASSYPVDKSNAHIRINTYNSLEKGSMGIDFTAKSGSDAEGGAMHSIMDRRAMLFTGVTVFARAQAVTLNPSGTSDAIQVGGGAQFTNGTNTEIMPGVDMIEILSGAYRGLYVIDTITSQFVVRVKRLNDSAPVFGAAVAATATIYRPLLSMGGSWGKAGGAVGNTGATGVGLTLVGERATTEQAAYPLAPLTLIAGGRDGLEGVVTTYGHRMAARILRYTKPGVLSLAGGFTGDGGFVNYLRNGQTYTNVVGTERAGALLETSGSATKRAIGVLVRTKEDPPTKDVFGVTTAIRGPALSLVVSLAHGAAQGVLTSSPTLMTTEGRPAPGSLFELVSPVAKAGIYKIANATGLSTYEFKLESDDGATPDFDADVSISGHVLYGTVEGNVQATVATAHSLTYEDDTQLPIIQKVALGVSAHEASTESSRASVNLALYNCGKYDSAFVRCFKGEDEKFAIRKTGDIVTAGTIRSAGNIRSTAGYLKSGNDVFTGTSSTHEFKYGAAKAFDDVTIPFYLWFELQNYTIGSTWSKEHLGWTAENGVLLNSFVAPLTSFVPFGAVINKVGIKYDSGLTGLNNEFKISVVSTSMESSAAEVVYESMALPVHFNTLSWEDLVVNPTVTPTRTGVPLYIRVDQNIGASFTFTNTFIPARLRVSYTLDVVKP